MRALLVLHQSLKIATVSSIVGVVLSASPNKAAGQFQTWSFELCVLAPDACVTAQVDELADFYRFSFHGGLLDNFFVTGVQFSGLPIRYVGYPWAPEPYPYIWVDDWDYITLGGCDVLPHGNWSQVHNGFTSFGFAHNGRGANCLNVADYAKWQGNALTFHFDFTDARVDLHLVADDGTGEIALRSYGVAPEPISLTLMSTGLLLLGVARRRRRRPSLP